MEGTNLERVTARSGEIVLRWQGRLTASSVAPHEEAVIWLNAVKDECHRCDRIVVLGVGSGYHLSALIREFPNHSILALDVFGEMIDAAVEIQKGALDRIELLSVPNEADLLGTDRIRTFLRSVFAVIDHSPSQQAAPGRYREIKARLLAREPIFFADWLRRDSRLANLFPLHGLAGGDEIRPLSIKDLARSVDGRGTARAEDVMIVKTLRELVK